MIIIIYFFSIIMVSVTLFFNVKEIDTKKNINLRLFDLEVIETIAVASEECTDCEAINLNCDSGGHGATSCSVGDWMEQCSVTCGSPCYACCDATKEECKCCY